MGPLICTWESLPVWLLTGWKCHTDSLWLSLSMYSVWSWQMLRKKKKRLSEKLVNSNRTVDIYFFFFWNACSQKWLQIIHHANVEGLRWTRAASRVVRSVDGLGRGGVVSCCESATFVITSPLGCYLCSSWSIGMQSCRNKCVHPQQGSWFLLDDRPFSSPLFLPGIVFACLCVCVWTQVDACSLALYCLHTESRPKSGMTVLSTVKVTVFITWNVVPLRYTWSPLPPEPPPPRLLSVAQRWATGGIFQEESYCVAKHKVTRWMLSFGEAITEERRDVAGRQ